MDTTDEKNEQVTPTVDEIKTRMIAVKERLPKNIKALFLHYHEDYNTYKKKSKIENAIYMRIADLDITEKLEAIADHLDKKI